MNNRLIYVITWSKYTIPVEYISLPFWVILEASDFYCLLVRVSMEMCHRHLDYALKHDTEIIKLLTYQYSFQCNFVLYYGQGTKINRESKFKVHPVHQ